MISPTTINRLREAVDLQALAADYVKLVKASSGDFLALCAVHKEDTPSLRIHKHTFHCFGCGWSGSAIDWVMQLDGLSFPDACRVLSERTGIVIDSKPVNRVAQAYAREEAECCAWWWPRYVARLRVELDGILSDWRDEYWDSPDVNNFWMHLYDPGPTEVFRYYQTAVTAEERKRFMAEAPLREFQAWEREQRKVFVKEILAGNRMFADKHFAETGRKLDPDELGSHYGGEVYRDAVDAAVRIY